MAQPIDSTTLSVTQVCGFPITPVGLEALVDHALTESKSGRGGWLLALNLDLVARSVREPEYGALLKGATLTFADGFPIVWSCRRKDRRNKGMPRVAGVDFTRALVLALPPEEVAIIGGRDPQRALTTLGRDPSGYYIFDGKVEFTDAFLDELAEKLKDRRVAFVALGVPKQERLISLLMPRLPEVLFIGVGGTFDFLAGLISRAPVWMQNGGLEWFYRLSTEPRRLWRRYLIEYPPGAVKLFRDLRVR